MQVGTKSAQLSFETARKRTREIGLTPDIRTFEKKTPRRFRHAPYIRAIQRGQFDCWRSRKLKLRSRTTGATFTNFPVSPSKPGEAGGLARLPHHSPTLGRVGISCRYDLFF